MKNQTPTKKINLSHRGYREAVDEAFRANICNPSIFWNGNDGFYVSPSSDLVPNSDFCLGLAVYSASGDRSFSGSRTEYKRFADAVRAFFSPTFVREERYRAPEIDTCYGSDFSHEERIYADGKSDFAACPVCGKKIAVKTYIHRITLQELWEENKWEKNK